MKKYTFFILVLLSSIVSAQDFVIKNVTLFDGESIIENTSVKVEDGLITEIGPTVSATTKEIDGTGKFLMPAMINSHVHAWAPTALTEAAKAGVLNLLDMHGVEQFQPMMANTKDSTSYARFYFAGAAATAPGGHGTQYGFPTPTLTKVEEAQGFVADRIAAGASYLKIIVEPWKETLSQDVVKALIDAAHVKEIKAVVHISKEADAQKVLQNGADGLVHIWWDKKMPSETLKELKKSNNFFIMPTMLTSNLILKDIRESAAEGSFLTDEEIAAEVKKVYDAGIPIIAGTDPPNAGINYGTDLHKELVLLSKAGIPALEVLKSATSTPASFFPLGKIGNIKKGYKADLVLLSKSPIQDMAHIATIEKVFKDGKEVARE